MCPALTRAFLSTVPPRKSLTLHCSCWKGEFSTFSSSSCKATGSLVAQMVKCLPAMRETRVQSLGQEKTWRMKGQPTPVLVPGKPHWQRSLAGSSPWGCKDFHFHLWPRGCVHAKSLQLCLTLRVPIDYSPLGFSVLGILQARILELVVVCSSNRSSWPRDRIHVSYICTGRRVL